MAVRKAGVSIRAFARRMGVTHQAVRKNIERGLITKLPDGSIDAARAEREWRANIHPGRGKKVATNGSAAPDAAEGYRTARAIRESFDARLLEIKYRLAVGELVEAKDVRESAFAAGRRVRDLLKTIAPRIAPVVAGLTDVDACYRVIDEEIDRALDELTKPGALQGGAA